MLLLLRVLLLRVVLLLVLRLLLLCTWQQFLLPRQ